MGPGIAPDETERAVLEVLAGLPISEAADRIRMEATNLAAAVEIYRQAGRMALKQQAMPPGWWQFSIQFTDWSAAETVAADHLAPILHRAETDGRVAQWWYIRKHPCWRLRIRAQPFAGDVKADISRVLDELTAADRLQRWWQGTYEPETAAFGGTSGMALAHELFHADSRAILELLSQDETALGRRELSVLLCSVLMCAAGLEWYEQGDVWHRVTQERPLPTDVLPDRLRGMADDLRRLMLANTESDGPLLGPNRPVAFATEWADAFCRTGRTLGAAARAGTLERGLRQVLAYHVIFHWNRLGLPARVQSILASAARAAILDSANHHA